MVDRRNLGSARARRPSRPRPADNKSRRADSERGASADRRPAARRSTSTERKALTRPAARKPRSRGHKPAAVTARAVERRMTSAVAPAPVALSLTERAPLTPLSAASAVAQPSSMTAADTVVVVRRRRRGPRVKFTRWLYSEDLYRQLGVSPRGQALVCRELRAERDGSWSARVAAVPAGFFEPTWVTVPPEVVVPVPRPKPA